MLSMLLLNALCYNYTVSYFIPLINYIILLFNGKHNGSGKCVTHWPEFHTWLSPFKSIPTPNVSNLDMCSSSKNLTK